METYPFVLMMSSLIIFAAFFIRSLTGFGSALISIPLLALLFDLKFIVPVEAVLEVGLSLLLLKSVYGSIKKSVLVPLIIGTVIGSLAGTYILASLADIWLKRLLGSLIMLFAFYQLFGQGMAQSQPIATYWGGIAGAIGGIFGGIFGTSGPPYVMYLSYQLKRKVELRATLIGLFTFDYGWRVGIFATTGLLTLESFKLALYLTPALIAGTYLGHRVHVQINEKRFQQMITLVLICSGLLLLLQ